MLASRMALMAMLRARAGEAPLVIMLNGPRILNGPSIRKRMKKIWEAEGIQEALCRYVDGSKVRSNCEKSVLRTEDQRLKTKD